MYGLREQGDWYHIEEDGRHVRTPMGQPAKTKSRVLADGLVADLETFGDDPSNPESLVAFHYAMIDFFAVSVVTLIDGDVVTVNDGGWRGGR